MGLSVCFYTREEFRSLLSECGFEIVQVWEHEWKHSWRPRMLLINRWGVMQYVVVKRRVAA